MEAVLDVSHCFNMFSICMDFDSETVVNECQRFEQFFAWTFLTRADASAVTETGARGPNKWSGAFRVSCMHVLASQPSHTCGASFNLQWNIQALLNNSVMLSGLASSLVSVPLRERDGPLAG